MKNGSALLLKSTLPYIEVGIAEFIEQWRIAWPSAAARFTWLLISYVLLIIS